MAAPLPPGAPPPIETLDDSDMGIDETAPPQRSPLRGALPFGPGGSGGARGPLFAPTPPSPSSPPPAPRYGEETAPPERSPLAAALPFRHAKSSAATTALPMVTPEDLARLTRGNAPAPHPPNPHSPYPQQAHGPAPAHASPVPAGGGPVAARSTGHFGLSIEQYAALCAEVAVSPDRADAIFAHYGLGAPKDRLTADSAWKDRLRADPALTARWQGLYLHYHEHYRRLAKR